MTNTANNSLIATTAITTNTIIALATIAITIASSLSMSALLEGASG